MSFTNRVKMTASGTIDTFTLGVPVIGYVAFYDRTTPVTIIADDLSWQICEVTITGLDVVVNSVEENSDGTLNKLDFTGKALEIQQVHRDGWAPNHSHVETAIDDLDRMRWRGRWEVGDYVKNDVVLDNPWTMVCIDEAGCTERAGLQPQGDPRYIYDGAGLTERSDIAKQIFFGNRYTTLQSGYINGYRLYLDSGGHYSVFFVIDPLGDKIAEQLNSFTATSDGWTDFSISSRLVNDGVVFDLVVLVSEPADTPVQTFLNYDYQKPNNPANPSTGVAIHPNKELEIIRFNYIDDDANDNTTFLQGLTIGDIIKANSIVWNVQGIDTTSDPNSIWITISPGTQTSPLGLTTFTFETVIATSIETYYDLNYWTTSGKSAQGLFGINVDYGDIVPDDTMYGVDVLAQDVFKSDQWDIVGHSG